ncbi:NACHT domain-containing protein [Ancylothrix sp. C2]|uniref:NACHT domain-containing protein n=1 Tax=Ancylothrix sp. D3o TaxID=2953691 RepID=UPI0021BB6FD0|nr:NACHT domain-containing protein [Ancylothrix sp. D3o]MCT7951609.1 NACHT domain-containing protein [Ancylothrix sp. D3o]
MDWQTFLREQAKNHDLSAEETDTLLKRFPEKDRYIKNEAQFVTIINEGISDKKYQIGVEAITKQMQKIYKKFQADCAELQQPSRGKLEILRRWLIDEFDKVSIGLKPLNRCILGLKGNYQQAQEKLTEITQHLQNLLNDKTLSIAKVEKGSIILIVQSSQTGYEEIKRLIGEKIIEEFSVEYVIDEWQDICRRMLIDRQPLTSNTVVTQAVGNRENRNLIDEDLFVDLELVKPKRSENAKQPQDINPEKGSDLFTRQEETVEKQFPYKEFLEKVIRKRTDKNIAIIGEPGAGKTTLLQKLAFWLLQETDDLVIWVSLAELGSKPLGEYLEEKWLKDAVGLSREEIKADWEQKFEGGAAWLLLDGFDEMSPTDQQALNFRGWVMDARMIVTCRLNLWQANPSQLQGFQTYLTQPFDDEKMQEFIRRWFRGLVKEGEDVKLAELLCSELQAAGKERIKDLCRNPLRLTLLCATWKVDQALPETMAKLYAKFVEAIYKWKKKAFTVNKEEKKQLNAALGELAKASLEAETSRFRLTHRLVCEYLGERDEDSLFDKALTLGWLNEVGVAAENRSEQVYTFYHATFQEYFAACSIDKPEFFLEHIEPQKWRGFLSRSYRIFEKHWKEVFLLWLGQTQRKKSQKDKLIKNLLNFQDDCGGFYSYRAFLLAAEGIAQFPDSEFADDIIGWLLELSFGFRLNIFNEQRINLVYGYNLILGNDSQIKTNIFWFAIRESATKILFKTNTTRVVELLVDYINRIVIISDLIECNFELDIEFSQINSQLESYLYFYWLTIITNIIDALIVLEPSFNLFDIEMKTTQNFYNDVVNFFIKKDFFDNTMILALNFLSQLGYQNAKELLPVKYSQRLLNHQNELIIIRAASVFKELKTLENLVDNCLPDRKFEVMLKIAELKANRSANLEIKNVKINEGSVIDFLTEQLLTRKHDFSTKLFMQMVILYVNQTYFSNFRTEIDIYELRKYFKKILSIENFRILKLDSLSMTEIILHNSEQLGFTPEEIVYWMSSILKSPITDENFQDFWEFLPRLNATLWYCAGNLPYPKFYQAWHHPPTTPNREVTEQTPHSGGQTFASPITRESLQHLPIYCLNAGFLANETRESEIAQTLCRLIWTQVCPQQMYPRVSTPADLCYCLDKLKFTLSLPHCAILFSKHRRSGDQIFLEPIQPTPELIAFCEKLTGVIEKIAFLTGQPLEAPLKGFPPDQPNLISAIETWLKEI